MAKVNKYPIKSFAPVVCKACGCEYEFEAGDTLERVFLGLNESTDINDVLKYEKNAFMLRCPICNTRNRIEKK